MNARKRKEECVIDKVPGQSGHDAKKDVAQER